MRISAGLGLGRDHIADFSSRRVLDGAECFYETLSLLDISKMLIIFSGFRVGYFPSLQGMFLVFEIS
jgi:hypothetical protein